jgi:hypothetical protein
LAQDLVRRYAADAANHFRSRWPNDKDLKHRFNVAEAKKLLAKKAAEEEKAEEQTR